MSEEEVAKTNRAWVLDFGSGLRAAVGHHEMWQVLLSPKLFDVPCTPSYCGEVLIFQDRILPVLSVSHLLEREKNGTSQIVGIAIYQDDPAHPIHYGGLHLAEMPQSIYVSDEQACDLPDSQEFWEPLAVSCFTHESLAIPIIELASLFSGNW